MRLPLALIALFLLALVTTAVAQTLSPHQRTDRAGTTWLWSGEPSLLLLRRPAQCGKGPA